MILPWPWTSKESQTHRARRNASGLLDWLEITQERVNTFADATGDHQWIHVDPERAKDGPFGGTIAHGYLTLSLGPVLMPSIASVSGVRMGVNYGCNKVRFLSPVKVGGKVRLGASWPTSRNCPATARRST